MNEYDRMDAELYDTYATGIEGDLDFYLEEATKAGSPVLELGCGTGRILIPIAQAGIDIVGLDRSQKMLSIAKGKIAGLPPETRNHIQLREGDMRDFSLDQRFNLVLIPFRAFLHLLTSEDQRLALGRIREHLVEGGLLALNIFDPSISIIAAHMGSLGQARKKIAEFNHPASGNKVIQWDTRRYDLENQIIYEYFIFEELDEKGSKQSTTYSPLKLRFLYRFEMQYLLELSGFKVEALYGDFQRGPFRHGKEQIWIARKS
jgi:SAM-dependent methyltransferase